MRSLVATLCFSLRRTMVCRTRLRLLRLPSYPVWASKGVPKGQQIASREPTCRAVGRRRPGGWLYKYRRKRRVVCSLPLSQRRVFRLLWFLSSSRLRSDLQQNRRLPHLPPSLQHRRDRGRRRYDTITMWSGRIRGTMFRGRGKRTS